MISFLIQLAVANRVILYAKTFLVSTVLCAFLQKISKKSMDYLKNGVFYVIIMEKK
jgi:hypothetical protein